MYNIHITNLVIPNFLRFHISVDPAIVNYVIYNLAGISTQIFCNYKY
jgi:hypothetical protein